MPSVSVEQLQTAPESFLSKHNVVDGDVKPLYMSFFYYAVLKLLCIVLFCYSLKVLSVC